MEHAPDEVKNMTNDNPNKFPTEIKMLLRQGCNERPEWIVMQVWAADEIN
ncbi:MAG: hypothetical protein IPL25_19100 [Saprospiraceae bacterium]|nr:hypothetical protein [Candidatus Vicinibacter affinis]